MKKSEKIRRKNKLKTVKNYRYLKYAQYACILIIVLFSDLCRRTLEHVSPDL